MLARIGLLCVCLMALTASADVVHPEKVTDVTVIDHKTPAWYFGSLEGSPHSYMLYLDEPQSIKLELVVPKNTLTKEEHGVIIVKQATRGVTEVARLEASKASWEPFFDLATGARYETGGTYQGELDTGIYTIEVQSPDNQGSYGLRFNDGGSLSGHGYVGKLRLLKEIHALNGRSGFAVLLSVYVYLPLLLLALAGLWLYWKKKKYA